MAEDSIGLGGRPGDRWRNHTDTVWWQWVSSLRKPCARCLRRHGRLFPTRPDKLHPHCQCDFLPVAPGAETPIEFRTRDQLLELIPAAGQEQLVGRPNWLIRQAGLVAWDDLFDGHGDPRDFDQVVKGKGLRVEDLVAAGVAFEVARRAVGGDR